MCDDVLINSNTTLNLFAINGLTITDNVIVPIQTEPYTADGLGDLIHIIMDGILIKRIDTRTNLSKYITFHTLFY